MRDNIGWMLAVAHRILPDRAHAEDAVQVSFAKIFAKADSFEGRSALKTWMHRIVVNEALMLLRKIKRRKELNIDDLQPNFDGAGCRVDQELTEFATPETLLQRAQTNQTVSDMIARLPEKYRIVLILRDIEGLSTADVSEALDLSEANVKVRLHRARAALKKLLEPMLRSAQL